MADLSDHCSIVFAINTSNVQLNPVNETLLPFPKSFKWSSEAALHYGDALCSPSVQKEVQVCLLTRYSGGPICWELEKIMQLAADRALKTRHAPAKGKSGRKLQEP